MQRKRARDRRVQKTEALLRGALGGLMLEKPYDAIVVKEILHRANVGRSTFYTHFADKDDLLVSCIHEVLRSSRSGGRARGTATRHEALLRFSRPIFEHIEQHRRSIQATMGPRGRQAMHRQLQHALTELTEAEVRRAHRAAGDARAAPPELLVHWIARTFVLVLNWWVESDAPVPSAEADRVFRSLVEPVLSEALG